jgi:hypothetical protein
MLSTFLQFRVFDDTGRRCHLDDIAVGLLESDYPAVTHFLYQNSEREQMMLPWHAVTGIDWRHARINVNNFGAAQSVTDESSPQEVLLKRDVLDALVLDLNKRFATRAHDSVARGGERPTASERRRHKFVSDSTQAKPSTVWQRTKSFALRLEIYRVPAG